MCPRPAERWWGRPVGIRLRATVIATAVVAGALLVGGALLVLLVHRSLIGSLDAAGQARARDVAAAAATGRQSATVASTGEESSVVQVVDSTGRVLAASPNSTGEPPLLTAPPSRPARQVLTRTGLPIGDHGQAFRVVAQPVRLPTGPGWVYVATSLAQVELTTARLALLLGLGVPALLAVVAATTWQAVGRGLRPVERLRAGAARISGAHPGGRVPVPATGDEITRLATTLNAMLARIDDAAARQQQFVGDASHELRSPLAAMRTELDVALAHPSSSHTGSGIEQLLTRLSQQATRMAELLHDLLFLARSDDDTARQYHQSVDLDELVLHEAHRLRALGATITLDGPDAVRLPGSANELARLLRNLGDNALTHTRTHITLGLRRDDTHAVLTVTDDGPGIPVSDRERIFARFSRLDTARPRTPAGGGSGLGLAISRQIARRHHGSITVDDSPTTTFTVRLPLPDTARTEGPDSAPRPPA